MTDATLVEKVAREMRHIMGMPQVRSGASADAVERARRRHHNQTHKLATAAIRLVIEEAAKVAENFRMAEITLRDLAAEHAERDDEIAHAHQADAAGLIATAIRALADARRELGA